MQYDVVEPVLFTCVLGRNQPVPDRSRLMSGNILISKPEYTEITTRVATFGERLLDGIEDVIRNPLPWPFPRSSEPVPGRGRMVTFRGRASPPHVELTVPKLSLEYKWFDEKFDQTMEMMDQIDPKFDIEVTYPSQTLVLQGAQVQFISAWNGTTAKIELLCDCLKPL